jgi:hypothetical protein
VLRSMGKHRLGMEWWVEAPITSSRTQGLTDPRVG